MYTIPTGTIKAATYCMAVKDVGSYLNGAHVTFNPETKLLRVESTNGYIAGRFEHTLPECEGPALDIIIPGDILKQAAKIKKPAIWLEPSAEGHFIIDGTLLFKPVDGQFPDLDRVIPKRTSGEVGQFDPEYLVACNNALKAYHGERLRTYELHHNGKTSAALMGDLNNGAVCVIMPVRI